MRTIFLAYASGNEFHESILKESAQQASDAHRSVIAWSDKDTSGQSIAKSVESWIEDADGFVGDISVVNMNVTYEIGYAIGAGKPVRLIRSTHTDYSKVKAVGLLDTLGHDTYDFHKSLKTNLCKKDVIPKWSVNNRNRDQPIFILQTPNTSDVSRTVISAVKKVARYKFRGFNPAEISRLNAAEAFEQVAASYGVIAFWLEGDDQTTVRNNQRAAFIYGVARGLDIPAILIAHESSQLPMDFHESANRWGRMEDLDGLIGSLRNAVADELVQHSNEETTTPRRDILSTIEFGDPIAENEQSQLKNFFIETDAFTQALSGQAHVLTGRKGSGKSAAFFQVRDRIRANKANIVVDLMPDGYQLIKLKEYILDKLAFGTRKEVVAAFWEYVLWLEIAYKILEKDKVKAKYDAETLERYQKLENIFYNRVDTGIGDFSERLKLLSDNIIKRFEEHSSFFDDAKNLKSSEVLEVIYGQDLSFLRDIVLDYLKIKGFVLFLFDNLDRIWTPGGFTADDADILVGLAEAMQEISRKFAKRDYDFRWVLFIRSDVYEFLVSGMADYGKLSTQSIEWSDREQLTALFNLRLVSYDGNKEVQVKFSDISVGLVDGKSVMDFIIDGSMMRPRYLIRLFETARRRTLALNRKIITEDDYKFALNELGWQALEDLDREIVDLVPNAKNLLFELLEHKDSLTPESLRYIAGKHINKPEDTERLIEVMIWNGSLGVRATQGDRFIFNTGYKRQYIAALISAESSAKMILHPTLCAAVI